MVKKENNENLVGILSYFLIGIIWYFVDSSLQKSKKLKFHVKQALNLFIINIVLSIFFSIIPFFGFIDFIFRIVIFVLWIIGLIYVIKEEEKEIPIIGQFAEKYLTF